MGQKQKQWERIRRWEDNIKIDLQEVEWTGLMWLRIRIGGCESGGELWGFIRCEGFLD